MLTIRGLSKTYRNGVRDGRLWRRFATVTLFQLLPLGLLFLGWALLVFSRSALRERRGLDGATVGAVMLVLLGSQSFWEGVDVRGEALSVVVIDKLPFAPPDDPVLAARIQAIRAREGNPFTELQLPQAVLQLKQGAGRLIRTPTDRGVVAVLDPELLRIEREVRELAERHREASRRAVLRVLQDLPHRQRPGHPGAAVLHGLRAQPVRGAERPAALRHRFRARLGPRRRRSARACCGSCFPSSSTPGCCVRSASRSAAWPRRST